MISMRLDKEEAKEAATCELSDPPAYPYGLELRLDDASLSKLGYTAPPPVGGQLRITALVNVTSASSYQDAKGEAESSSCWQITDLEVAKTSDPASTLYPDTQD